MGCAQQAALSSSGGPGRESEGGGWADAAVARGLGCQGGRHRGGPGRQGGGTGQRLFETWRPLHNHEGTAQRVPGVGQPR